MILIAKVAALVMYTFILKAEFQCIALDGSHDADHAALELTEICLTVPEC